MSTSKQEVIQAAIAGLETQKQQIDERIAELRVMLSGANSAVSVSPAKGRRTTNAAARKRIADAMRKRESAVEKNVGSNAAAPVRKKAKRRLSPEGRRRIIEATKKRWAAVRAAAAKSRK